MKYTSFNTEESLLVVTSYPDPEKGIKELNAVAWHSHKTLHSIAKESPVIVLAEKLESSPAVYKDGSNLLVKRVWKRGNVFSLLSILKNVVQNYNIRTILFQFEFNIFGGMLPVLVLPLLLLVFKLLGKRVFFELHQVVLDIKALENHINVKNRVMQKLFNIALRNFYRTVGLLSTGMIVFEQDLKERLSKLVDINKISVLPLSVDKKKILPKHQARMRFPVTSKDFIVLVFGFVNWYKGSDWIVKLFAEHPDKNIKLILAGGKNPTLSEKAYYQKFYNDIAEIEKTSSNITLSGFIPDDSIGKYFAAADMVVLPYRVFMSASGPFSFALSYKKPILLSDKLLNYSKSEDVQEVLKEVGLKQEDLFFSLESTDLLTKLYKAKNVPEYMAKLQQFSEKLAQKRSSKFITQEYINLFRKSMFVKSQSFSFGKVNG